MINTAPEFTSRDFDTNVAALVEAAKKALPGRWTSFRDADFGQALLELIAYDSSITSFITDEQHRERFLSTLSNYESAILFAVQNGYRPRLQAPASLEATAELTENPDPNNAVKIRSGTPVRAENGAVWEVDGNYEIPPNRRYPSRTVLAWGQMEHLGEAVYVSIDPESSRAYLSDFDGNRLPSDVSFSGRGVGPGHILSLTGQKSGDLVGPAPPISRRDFAVVEVGGLSTDLNDGAMLHLDRQWDGEDRFTGTFIIESNAVSLTQGITREEVFQGPAAGREGHVVVASFPGISSVTLEPFIPSSSSPVAAIPASAVTVNGQVWRETSSLALEGPSDAVYEASVDADQKLVIRFGDGINGKALPVSAEIAMRYRTSSGSSGNVQRGGFAANLNAVQPNGRVASIALSNPYTRGSGGSDRESLGQLKAAISGHVRTNDRAVTAGDFEALATNFRSNAHGAVGAVSVDHDRNVMTNNLVNVRIWAEQSNGQLGKPSLGLLSDLRAYLSERSMVTDEVITSAGRSVNVPMSVRYRYDRNVTSESEAYEAVRSAINSVLRGQQPGSGVQLGDLYEAVEAVHGIKYADFHTPNTPLPPYRGVYTNSLQLHSLTRPTVPSPYGTYGLQVEDPQFFTDLGPVSVFEIDRRSMFGTVERVSGSLLTMRQESPLADRYSPFAHVINGDYLGVGWADETKLDLFVRVGSGNANSVEVERAARKKLGDYFRWFVLPGETVHRETIREVLSSVPNVSFNDVSLNLPASETAQVQGSPQGKIVLNQITFL